MNTTNTRVAKKFRPWFARRIVFTIFLLALKKKLRTESTFNNLPSDNPCNHPLGSKSPFLGVILNLCVFMYTCLKSKIVPQAKLELPFCKGYLQYTKSSI